MKRITYNKLIRDKIPERIKDHGGDYKIKTLGVKEFEAELLKKVGEEATGLLAAKTKREMTSEIADIIDVIEEIKRLKKITDKDIEEARKTSLKAKGGFEKRLFLFWSSDTGYKSNERRYRRQEITGRPALIHYK